MYKFIYTIRVLSLASVLLISGCASITADGQSDQNYKFSSVEDVAVVKIEGAFRSEAVSSQIGDMVNKGLLGKGYSAVERSQVKSVLKESQFQNQIATSSSGAAKIGEVLNVDSAMIVNVPKYDNNMSMSAKMIDVETARIVWTATGTAKTGSGLSKLFGGLIGASTGALAGNAATDMGSAGAVVGGAGGATAGAAGGAAMTPQKEGQAAKLIEKMMESLPERGGS